MSTRHNTFINEQCNTIQIQIPIEFHNIIPTQHKIDTVQCRHNTLVNEQHNTNTNYYIRDEGSHPAEFHNTI